MKSLLLYGLLVLSCLLRAGERGNFQFQKNGTLKFGDIEMKTNVMYGPKWSSTQITNPRLEEKKDLVRFRSNLEASFQQEMTGSFTYTCVPEASGGFRFSGKMEFPKELPIRTAHLGFTLPLGTLVYADGKKIALPETAGKLIVARQYIKKLNLVVPGGKILEISGPFHLIIQDNRLLAKKFHNFAFRIAYPQIRKQRELALNLSIKGDFVKSQMVDITKAANRGFKDDFSDDGKGGWTDQGSGNDLRMVPAGIMKYDRIPFRVLDERKFPGRTVIAVAGTERSIPVREVSLDLPENNAKGISLLHSSAWTPPEFGQLIVTYENGTEQTFPIRGTKECGNWCGPRNRSNGLVLWRGFTTQNEVGLYVSSFRLTGEKPKRLTFRITDRKAVWLVAGVTLNERYVPVQFRQEQEVIVREGKEWVRLDFQSRIPKGSALDFSFLTDAPAGKYGRIIAAPDGRLVYEKRPDQTVRLWGENICQYALRHSKPVFRSLAEYFSQMGLNLIRLHHHDNDLVDPKSKTSTELNYEHLDRLEYFVSELKKNGIYITTDLFTSRKVKPGDAIPEMQDLLKDKKNSGPTVPFKVLVPFSEAAFNNWKTFAGKWMTHRNPYTGMTWAEDPALVYVNLINEDNLAIWWNSSGLAPYIQKKFDQWTAQNNLPRSSISNMNRDFRRFLDETHSACYRKMTEFLRKECGMKAMITSQNFYSDIPVTILRNQFDIVDDHLYGDHPSTWGLPQGYSQGDPIRAMGGIARQFTSSRIFGKPFSITEFSIAAPNIHRSCWGPLMGGYAAFQDWNSITRFAYGFSTVNSTPRRIINDFESANEPMAQFSDRIFAALFRRGDVRPAPKKSVLKLPADFYRSNSRDRGFPGEFQMLGLITATGCVIGNSPLPDGADTYPDITDPTIRKRWQDALKKRIALSSTGELYLDANQGIFKVDTPRTQSISLPGGNASSSMMKIRNATTLSTIALISLDGKPLRETGSSFLFHLTDVCNSNIHFANEMKTLVLKKGNLPLLLRRGSAEISLASQRPFKVTALNCDGGPKGEIPGKLANGTFSFQVRNDRFPGGIMAYHLTR